MTQTPTADPLVTVVIAAWNAEGSIERAIKSALDQTIPVEVIVVDDQSQDGTLARAKVMAENDPRLTVLAQSVNQGPSAARNRALKKSRAPWVTVLDSDDWIEPGRLAALVELSGQFGCDFIADDLWKVDAEDPKQKKYPLLGNVNRSRRITAAEFVISNLSAKHGGRREMGFLKPLMSRSFLEQNELTYDPNIRLGEDFVLYTKALLSGAVFILTEPAGYFATVRSGSLSNQHPTEAHAHLIEADLALLERNNLAPDTRRAISAHLMEQRKKYAWRRLIDAAKASDPSGMLRCFWAPPQVAANLVGRLGEEIWARYRCKQRTR